MVRKTILSKARWECSTSSASESLKEAQGEYWASLGRLDCQSSRFLSQRRTSIVSAADFLGTSIMVVSMVPPNLWPRTEYCAVRTRLIMRQSFDLFMNITDNCLW